MMTMARGRLAVRTSGRGTAAWAVVLLAAWIVAAGTAHAQHRNAAEHYRRAIERLERLDEGDWEAVEDYRADPSVVPPGLREAMAKAGPALADLQRGARQDVSDFGLDYSQGWDLLLPHLGPMRRLARVAQADIYLRLHDGDAAGAADRLAGLYRYAEHLGRDRTMISSLVGNAVFRLTDETVQYGVDRAAFDAGASADLHRSLQQYNSADPFGAVEALVMEQELTLRTIQQSIDEAGDPAAGLQKLGALISPEGADDIAMALANADVDQEIASYDALMGEVIEAFSEPDAELGAERLEEIAAELQEGEHGMLAMLFMPAFTRVHARLNESREMIEDRMAQLEEIAEGRVDPIEEANALHFYLQAFDAWNALDAADRAALLAYAKSGGSIDEQLGARLDRAKGVLEFIEQGAARRRCDFDLMPARGAGVLIQGHEPVLRECLALLRAAAREGMANDRRGDGVPLLATSLRVIGHFDDDPAMLTPIVLHGAFGDVARLIEAEEAAGRLTDGEKSVLRDGWSAVGMKDPFGWVASLMHEREALASLIVHRIIPAELQTGERAAAVMETLRTMDGDDLLAICAVLDAPPPEGKEANAEESDADEAKIEVKSPIQRLGDLIDVEQLKAARRMGGAILPALARGDLETVMAMDPPAFARFDERRVESRGMMRRLGRLLRVEEPKDDGASDAETTESDE